MTGLCAKMGLSETLAWRGMSERTAVDGRCCVAEDLSFFFKNEIKVQGQKSDDGESRTRLPHNRDRRKRLGRSSSFGM